MPKKQEYKDSDIKILKGLEAVRQVPGMYIGSTDIKGFHHLAYEILDNAVDEALNGFGKEIRITIHKDNSLTIEDNGRGVPHGKHPSGKNTMEVIYGQLHAGGKFEEGVYKSAGGLHGVGGSVVNALSEWMIVESTRDKEKAKIKFEKGGEKRSKVTVKKISGSKTGTSVTFLPDKNIFKDCKWEFSTLCTRARETAHLINNLKFVVKDERKDKEEVYIYKDGMKEFLNELSDSENVMQPLFIDEEDSETHIRVKLGMKVVDNYSEIVESFANLVRTPDGGSHEVGLRSALTRAFNYSLSKSNIRTKVTKLDGNDVREGLVCVLSVTIPEGLSQFEGQTKGKLGTPIAKQVVENIVYENLKKYLESKPTVAKALLQKMTRAADAREAARNARNAMREGKDKDKVKKLLSSKLSPARGKDASKNELFIVEGEESPCHRFTVYQRG